MRHEVCGVIGRGWFLHFTPLLCNTCLSALTPFFLLTRFRLLKGGTSTITSTLFLVGSFYYVSGSYPYEGQFYYAKETSQTSNMKVRKRRATFSDERSAEDPVFNPLTDSVGYEVVGALKKERVQTLETVPEGQIVFFV